MSAFLGLKKESIILRKRRERCSHGSRHTMEGHKILLCSLCDCLIEFASTLYFCVLIEFPLHPQQFMHVSQFINEVEDIAS